MITVDFEEIKKEKERKFIDEAVKSGFTEEQAKFLYKYIYSKIMTEAIFGGIF